jgi:hypothetical protein
LPVSRSIRLNSCCGGCDFYITALLLRVAAYCPIQGLPLE